MADESKVDTNKFFGYIVFGFVMAVVSGLWAAFVLIYQDNIWLSNPYMAGIMVGMTTTSVSVIVVLFTSTMFQTWLKDKLELRKVMKEKLRLERLRKIQGGRANPIIQQQQQIQQIQQPAPQIQIQQPPEKAPEPKPQMDINDPWGDGVN